MKNQQYVVIAVAAILALTSPLSAARPVHQVQGGGTVDFPQGREAYGFEAKIDASGAIKGQGHFHFVPPVEANFHAEINCLAVDGNTAWLGMEVTWTDGGIALGLDLTWQIRDNGEGAGDPPDQQSFFFATDGLRLFGFDADSCLDMPDLFSVSAFDWTNGNLQVK